MVKSRFSSLDVRAMVNSIRPEAVGCKLTNVYDINSKVYVFKLARKNFKCFLLLESGVRFHLTKYERDKSSVPSNYSMKLRKHIRTKRLTDIQQLGVDRVVDFTFGKGDTAFHLILELFVTGNIILTDHEYKILVLLRAHTDDKGGKVSVKQTYPVDNAMGLSKVPLSDFDAAVDDIIAAAEARRDKQEDMAFEEEDRQAAAKKTKESNFRKKKRPDHMGMPLFQILHKLLPWTDPQLCAACTQAVLRWDGYDGDGFKTTVEHVPPEETANLVKRAAELALEKLRSVSRPIDLGGGNMALLAPADEEADDDADAGEASDAEEEEQATKAEDRGAPVSQEMVVPGWIMKKRVHVPPAEPRWTGEDFTPLPPPSGTEPEASETFPTFHKAVDEFFVRLEETRAEEQKAQHAQTVFAKVERIRQDQGRRVEVLEAEQETSERLASLIEGNVELVERSLAMLNAMLASQLDWGELWREVKRQQRLGHPIAEHIHSLDLERNEMKLLLSPPVDEDADPDDLEAEQDRPMDIVPLDLSLSAHANVAALHSKRKQTREKTSKTLAHAEAAVKQAEKKAHQDLQKFQLKQTIRRVRQVWWFEKFTWFISSENYLVLAGRDARQTEQLFCRQMGPRDVLVQADVGGVTSTFIINSGTGEVPPATLREAGTMALSRSAAWDKKLVISPWWVPLGQVTRGEPPPGTNDYIFVDGFFVQGHRRFLPPIRLEMGFTLLYHVEGADAQKHKGERKSIYMMGGAEEQEERPGSDGDVPSLESLSAHSGDEAGPAADPPAAPVQGGSGNGQEAPQEEEEGAIAGAGNDASTLTEPASEQAPEATDALEEAEEAEPWQNGGDVALAEDDEATATSRGTAGGGQARVSKAERRKGKKLADGDAGPVEDTADSPAAKAAPSAKAKAKAKAQAAAKAEAVAASAKGPAPLPRGQKAKLKKMKEKYGDQDDEERELRLVLLGSKAPKHLERAAGGPKAAEADTAGEEAVAPPSPTAAPARPEHRGDAQGGEATGGGAGAKAKGKGKGKGKGAPEQQKKPGQVLLLPGCEADDSFDPQLGQLDLLTGQPQPEDEVLYCFPMVAPYCSLNGPYSFRVKITPGNIKKFPAAKTCLKMFENQSDKPAWKQLVRAIPEQDAAAMLNGSCRLSAPGMQKLQQQASKEKKKEKKDEERASKKAA